VLTLLERPPRNAVVAIAPAARAVVSWNASAPSGELALIAHYADGTRSAPLRYVRWSPAERRSLDGADGPTRIAVDIVRSETPLHAIEVVDDLALDALAVAVPPPDDARAPALERTPALDVPQLSQYLAGYPHERGWCSAAALTMLLRFHGIDAGVDETARAVYDASYGGTGNWTFNVAYAAKRGLCAAVAYLAGLDHAAAFVAAGLPVALSISWQPGELPGAPLEYSDGHLVVLRGVEPDAALVNDPAHPQVAVRYPREALDRVFRSHGGVAYLIARRSRTAELVTLANIVAAPDRPAPTEAGARY